MARFGKGLGVGFALVVMALAACVPDAPQLDTSKLPKAVGECAARGTSRCYFANVPVQLTSQRVDIPSRKGVVFRPIAAPVRLVDGKARAWVAGAGVLTDGASIPPVFHRLVGNPTSREFAGAAAVHDAYCGIGNERRPEYHARSWEDVHKMFYDGLIVGGTPTKKAQIMFAAVWLGGPRWGRYDPAFDSVTDQAKIEALSDVIDWIGTYDLSFPELLLYLDFAERRMLSGSLGQNAGGSLGAGETDTGDDTGATAPAVGGGWDPTRGI